MIKILFICLGNICRSPAAEAVMRKIVEDAGQANNFKIESAGTSGLHAGGPADPRMKERARLRGLELSGVARQFEAADFDRFNFIIVMDESNRANVLRLAKGNVQSRKVLRMTEFAQGRFSKYTIVPDPYYGGMAEFDGVLDLLEHCCKNFFVQVMERLKS